MERIEDRIGRSPDDPLVNYLTAGGILLTVVGVVGGVWMDAANLVGNLFANLVLIGPALAITNILVAYVNRTRSRRRAQWHVAMVGGLLLPAITVADEFLQQLGSDERCVPPELFTTGGEIDLNGIVAAIDRTETTVIRAAEKFAADSTDDTKPWMSISGDVFTLPNMTAVQILVNTIDGEIPCSSAVLSAAAAEQFSRYGHIDFVFHGRGSPLRPPGEDPPYVREPKMGFGEIGVWMMRGMQRSDDHITVWIESYYDFALECLSRSRNVLNNLIEAAPKGLVAAQATTN